MVVLHYWRDFFAHEIVHAVLGVIYGLPAIVAATAVPALEAEYVLVTLAAIVLIRTADDVRNDETGGVTGLDELSGRELRRLLVVLNVATVVAVTLVLLASTAIATAIHSLLGAPVVALGFAVVYPVYEADVGGTTPRLSVEHWGFRRTVELLFAVYALRTDGRTDGPSEDRAFVEETARRGGPML